jgi:hypothetical protein
MVFSRWRPDRGGYDYFETGTKHGLGDDLPVPQLPAGTALGVASIEAGRALPAGAKHVGSGAQARGSVVPLSRAGLGSVALGMLSSTTVGALAVGLLVGWLAWGRKKAS